MQLKVGTSTLDHLSDDLGEATFLNPKALYTLRMFNPISVALEAYGKF